MFAFYLYSACSQRLSISPEPGLFFVFNIAILMDLTIVALTFSGLYQQAALDSPIGSSLSEQSLWYCVGTLLCNIPAVLLPGLNLNGKTTKPPSASHPKTLTWLGSGYECLRFYARNNIQVVLSASTARSYYASI